MNTFKAIPADVKIEPDVVTVTLTVDEAALILALTGRAVGVGRNVYSKFSDLFRNFDTFTLGRNIQKACGMQEWNKVLGQTILDLVKKAGVR